MSLDALNLSLFRFAWADFHDGYKNVFFLNPKNHRFLELFSSGRYRVNKLMESVPIRIKSTAIDSMDVGLFGKPKNIAKLLLSFENHHFEVREIPDFRKFPKVFLWFKKFQDCGLKKNILIYLHENPLTRSEKAEDWEHLGTFGKKEMSKT